MIPFNGFMQANTFSTTVIGGKPVNLANPINGSPDKAEAIAPFDDATGSFLQWVQKLVDDDMPAEPDCKGVQVPEMVNHEGDSPPLDPLQLPIAESIDQPPVSPYDPQAPIGEHLEDGQRMMLPVILNAVSAQHGGRQVEDGQGTNLIPDLPSMHVKKIDPQAVGQTPSVGDALPNQLNTEGQPTQNEKGEVHAVKENLFMTNVKDDMPIEKGGEQSTVIEGGGEQSTTVEKGGRQKTPMEMVSEREPSSERAGKEINPLWVKPVKPANQTVNTNTDPAAQQRSGFWPGTSPTTVKPASVHGQPIAGNTEGPAFIEGTLTDEKSTSSKNDTTSFQDSGKGSQTQRMAFAEVKENELQKDQSLDAMKSFGAEQIKPDPSFQDSAKAISAQQSTIVAEKTTLGQAAALARSETSAAGTFESKVMDQIVDKASLRSIQGRSEVRISLKPEFLGKVQMNISTHKEQVVVRITTDQPVVKEIIESHLHHLKAELQNQGLTIDKFDVMVNPDADQQHHREPFSQMFKNNSSNDGKRQAPDQNPEKGNPKGSNDDDDDDQRNRDGVNYFA